MCFAHNIPLCSAGAAKLVQQARPHRLGDIIQSSTQPKPQQRERERDTELRHSCHDFSKRVLALLQRAASMVVAKLQRATTGMVVMVMSARTVRRRSQINDGLPQARTRAEQAGQRRRWWWHHYGPEESESVPEPTELKDTARATCGGTNCFALHEAREIMFTAR